MLYFPLVQCPHDPSPPTGRAYSLEEIVDLYPILFGKISKRTTFFEVDASVLDEPIVKELIKSVKQFHPALDVIVVQ